MNPGDVESIPGIHSADYIIITGDITRSTRRPWKVKALCLAILLIGVFHVLRFVQVLINIKILQSLPMTVSPVYLAVDGLLWGISGIILSWSLWTGISWARKSTLVIILSYTIKFWVDLIWITEPIVLHTRWLITLFLTIIGLPAVYFSLYSKSSQDYFEGNPATID